LKRIVLIALGVVVLFVAVQAALFLGSSAGEPGRRIVRIYPGTGLAKITQMLEEQGLIASAWKFQLLARITGKAGRVKAGEYELDPSMGPWKILSTLSEGRVRLYRVTIPEGYNMFQVANAMASTGLIDRERFLGLVRDPKVVQSFGLPGRSLEGYLYPDTYELSFFTTEEQAVKMMVGRFLSVWKRHEQNARERGLSLLRTITLASLVEKETGEPSERPLIAAVFGNRLRQGVRLQCDPTVIYGVMEADPDGYDGNLTRRHLTTPTPYNTYCQAGLPAGPIANPGEASIKAALEPARTDCLYFVSRNDGSHHFSATLAEHNEAVARYQKDRRARNAAIAAHRAEMEARKAAQASAPGN